jgi:DNA-binding response OmpR family regulator
MAKILVIDDDEQCSDLLKTVFEQSGHMVATAADGKAGLKMSRAGHFDLVITDVLMPEKDGLELIKELCRDNPDVQIIAISGGGLLYAEDCLKMAKLFGAKHILKKPIDIKVLLQIAAELKPAD